METQGPTITEVVTNIVKLVAAVGGFTTILTVGVTEFVKKFTDNSKVIATAAMLVGFFASITIMHIFGQTWFSALSVLVGVSAALAAPGFYSVTTTFTRKTE